MADDEVPPTPVSRSHGEDDENDHDYDAKSDFAASDDEESVNGHRSVREEMDDFVTDLLNAKDIRAFFRDAWDSYDCLEEGVDPDTGKTILHLLVEKYTNLSRGGNSGRASQKNVLGTAIRRITQKYPKHVGVLDTEKKQTPLFSAIINKKMSLVTTIVHNCRKSDLAKALEVKCHYDGNWENTLHRALHRNSESVFAESKVHDAKAGGPDALLTMCRVATKSTISAVDSENKYTPLHHACHYERSSAQQLKLIKILLKTGDAADLIDQVPRQGVLDKYARVPDRPEPLSVYEYHLHTREEARRQGTDLKSRSVRKPERKDTRKPTSFPSDDKKDIKRGDDKRVDDRRGDDKREGKGDDQLTKQPGGTLKVKPTRLIAPEGPSRKPDPKGDGKIDSTKQGRDDPRRPTARPAGKDVPRDRPPPGDAQKDGGLNNEPNMGLRRSNTGHKESEQRGEDETEEQVEETPEDRQNKKDAASDMIQDEIKVQFMRTRTYAEITRFLYGKNPKEIQICFDYLGQPETADAVKFKRSFKDMSFDSVLKYVAFPTVKVENWSKSNEGLENRGRGRCDMLFFFKWLRDEKNVKRILKVIVDDSSPKEYPHADEIIEQCLQGFDVEILEWTKKDLDPVTICNVGQKLRSLSLLWGGDNVVLRGWSDPEGLRALPCLSTIHLRTVSDHYEGFERMERNRSLFEKRMRMTDTEVKVPVHHQKLYNGLQIDTGADSLAPPKPAVRFDGNASGDEDQDGAGSEIAKSVSNEPLTLRNIAVIRPDGGGRSLSSAGFSAQGSNDYATRVGYRWLEATDSFGKLMWTQWNSIGGAKHGKDIIVALIDDGIDHSYPGLAGKVLTGRTFAFDEDNRDAERVGPWYTSERGHGTVMATSILRVCPMAKIYPIKFNYLPGPKGNIEAKSAARAIHAAVDRGVDIISMSWTVDPPEGEVKELFDKAITRAIENDILMFCSASDEGHFTSTERHYPTNFRREAVFKVGAARPEGLPYDWVGPVERLDFILPGVEVVANHRNRPPGVQNLLNDRPKTGSSVATALGAGLAATILYTVLIARMSGHKEMDESTLKNLRKRDAMRNAILALGEGPQNNKFVEVAGKLERTAVQVEIQRSNEAKWRIIAELARDLVPGIRSVV